MPDYLSHLKEEAGYAEIASFMPEGICPFLFYNLTPYIFTLAKGGWFSWVKKCKDTSYRKPINKHVLGRKNVNAFYPNEVLVRCPNPCNAVVAAVGLWPKDKIKIRILYSTNSCLNEHKPGEEILADNMGLAATNALAFNRVFPRTLCLSLTGRLPERKADFRKTGREITVNVAKIIFPCRYHKDKKEFKPTFLPGGFSPHAFAALYPHILAMMYNAKMDRKLRIKHPGKETYVTLTLDKIYLRKNRFVKTTLESLRKLFETVFHPVDLLDYDFEINILENESTESSLKKGIRYMVNLRDTNFLCPASFHTLYPYLLLAASGSAMRWDGDKATGSLPCPDCVGTVYSINK